MNKRKLSAEATVGLLVLVGIVILFFMSFRITRLERVAGEMYTALFASVSGLNINGQVEVAGVPVGRVETIELERGKARVWMRIGRVTLFQDAEAIMRTSGVLGDKFIEIKPGSPPFPAIPPGGEIKRVTSATDMDQFFATLENTARDFGQLGQSLQEMLGGKDGAESFQQLIVNLNDASGEIKQLITDNKDKVAALLTNFEKFSRDLTPLREKAERTLSNLEEMSARVKAGEGTLGKILADESLYNEAKATIEEAKNAMAGLQRMVARVEQGQGSLGKLMSDETLYDEATKTIKKVQRASERLEETTPVTALAVVLGLFF